MTMSGPLLTGFTQTINDYYDKEIDAINEPYRPIPSGTVLITPMSRCMLSPEFDDVLSNCFLMFPVL